MAECVHGMNPDWCGYCKSPAPAVPHTAGGPWPGLTKQDVLDVICEQLGIQRYEVGVGSSVPSDVFDVIRDRLGLPAGSMPEVAEACASKAGLSWEPEFDSRSTLSGGGSTVTLPGLQQVSRALAKLL